MKLILSSYIRILKERDELDVLLPDLLVNMGIIPLSKPQTGTRQYGVDLTAVGPDLDDNNHKKLFLFVIKQGDIGRSVWDSGLQSVRQSLNEIFDIYLRSHAPAKHKALPIKIVLCTSGDLKEDTQAAWAGYTDDNASRAEFDFWGAEKLASLIDKFMLNEHLFSSDDRYDFRRALALASEIDYSLADFHRLLRRQLGLTSDGSCVDSKEKIKEIKRSMNRVNLATRVLAGWAINDGNSKQAVFAAERALLWSWHRIQQVSPSSHKSLYPEFLQIWQSYEAITKSYFERLHAHCYVRDALSVYSKDNAIISINLLEQIGLISSIGLANIFAPTSSDEQKAVVLNNANVVANALLGIIKNNPASSSPRLDSNALDITLALLLLFLTGKYVESKDWLREMVKRIDYVFRVERNFPIDNDSLDDLAALEAGELEENEVKKLMTTSWMLPTLAGWSVILQEPEAYGVLKTLQDEVCKNTCKQLWHPVQDVFEYLYFKPAHYESGETDAPIVFPEDLDEYRRRMLKLLDSTRHDVTSTSPAAKIRLIPLDFIACRHFRTPVAPFFWYRLAKTTVESPLQC